jgi:hypothetical protein
LGYTFSANHINAISEERGTSMVYVSDIVSPDRTTANVNWFDYHYPNTLNNSANSVYLNNTIAFFELEGAIYAHAFVVEFNFTDITLSVGGDDDDDHDVDDDEANDDNGGGGGNGKGFPQSDTIAFSVVGSAIGVALLAYAASVALGVKGAAAAANTALAGTSASAGNPMAADAL